MRSNTEKDSHPATSWAGPLTGIKVLDLTHVLAGPYLTQLLADQGAEVLKVEAPGDGDETRNFAPYLQGESHYYLGLNRNKKSLVIDFKKKQGQTLLQKLASQADILVENFRPGLMKEINLDYETLAALNPRLIYCSISGFGMSGPLRDKPAFDIVTQAMSGALSINGEPNRNPVKIGLPLGDLVGGVFGSVGVLSALHERNHTGKGRLVDISLHDGLMGMLGYLAQLHFVTGNDPTPVGSGHPNIAPYGAFPASDGQIIIACLLQSFWLKLCDALNSEALKQDPRFLTADKRLTHRQKLDELIAKITRQKNVNYWVKQLDHHGVPHAPVLGIGAALHHPHSKHRNMIVEADHPIAGKVKMVGRSIKYPGSPQKPLKAAPILGQHTIAILKTQLGISDSEIESLTDSGVINRINIDSS